MWDGLKNVDDVVHRLYDGDSSGSLIQDRAKELFQKAFRLQAKEKENGFYGEVKKSKSGKRQKFSKRKQFVVTSILQALDELKIRKWDLKDLNALLDGIEVSENSLATARSDLGLSASRVPPPPPSRSTMGSNISTPITPSFYATPNSNLPSNLPVNNNIRSNIPGSTSTSSPPFMVVNSTTGAKNSSLPIGLKPPQSQPTSFLTPQQQQFLHQQMLAQQQKRNIPGNFLPQQQQPSLLSVANNNNIVSVGLKQPAPEVVAQLQGAINSISSNNNNNMNGRGGSVATVVKK